MKILYDYQAFNMQSHGGVSRCFIELTKQLCNVADIQIAVKKSNNIHLNEFLHKELINSAENASTRTILKSIKEKTQNHNFFFNNLIEKIIRNRNRNYRYSIDCLKNNNFDIFHPTYFDDYFIPYLKNKPFVLTVHDMINERFPEYFPHSKQESIRKKKLVDASSKVVAVSNHTKNDLIELFNVPEKKIEVIYHGTTYYKGTYINLFDNPYFLFIGGRFGKYKNFIPLIHEIAPYLRTHKDVYLVCTSVPFKPFEIDLFKSLGIENQIKHRYTTEAELFSLYK